MTDCELVQIISEDNVQKFIDFITEHKIDKNYKLSSKISKIYGCTGETEDLVITSIHKKSLNIAKYLAHQNVNIDVGSIVMNLEHHQNFIDMLKYLIENNLIDVNTEIDCITIGGNIINLAIQTSSSKEVKELTEFLVSKGADYNARNKKGETALIGCLDSIKWCWDNKSRIKNLYKAAKVLIREMKKRPFDISEYIKFIEDNECETRKTGPYFDKIIRLLKEPILEHKCIEFIKTHKMFYKNQIKLLPKDVRKYI